MSRAVRLSPPVIMSALLILPASVAMAGSAHHQMRHRPTAPVANPAGIVANVPLLVIPLTGPFLQPRFSVGQAPVSRAESHAPANAAPRRAAKPLSFAPLDSRATISRTPSGRIFMGAPADVYPYPETKPAQRPYAQPAFHLVGVPSSRHMAGDVKLTHGVAAPRDIATTPKVVWLDQQAPRRPRIQSAK